MGRDKPIIDEIKQFERLCLELADDSIMPEERASPEPRNAPIATTEEFPGGERMKSQVHRLARRNCADLDHPGRSGSIRSTPALLAFEPTIGLLGHRARRKRACRRT
jgi:hypothetical protein